MAVLMMVMLLAGCLPALADVDDWEIYESGMGFTILYPDFLVNVASVPSAETGLETVQFVPLEDEDAAGIWCRQVDEPDEPDWEARGYERLSEEEIDFDPVVPMETRIALYRAPDGKEMLEEIRLESLTSTEDFPAGFEYVFDLRFPADDPDDWRGIFEAMLETLSFPGQPAEAGSFRLTFFQGGAAGMRFIPILVDEEADAIVLMPLAEVTDFVLEKLNWDDETFSVTGAEPLYTADRLAPGDNLEIICWFSDILPDLRVRCVNESGEPECWYLFESGMDGSLLLLSEADVMWDMEE